MDLIPSVSSAMHSDQRLATGPDPQVESLPEEALVADTRAALTPAQLVERKLVYLLNANPLPVSHVMAGSRPLRPR
jgi:hypothetical protein